MDTMTFSVEALVRAIVSDTLSTTKSESLPAVPPSGNNYTIKPARVIYASNKTIARILPERTSVEYVQDSPCGGFYFNWKGKLYLAPAQSRKSFKLETSKMDIDNKAESR